VRILADMHVSPRTVARLVALGHDAVVLPAIQAVVGAGAIVAVEDAVVRIRTLPLA
jgi:hypothetical protein